MSSNVDKKDLIKEILIKNKDKINNTIEEKDINILSSENEPSNEVKVINQGNSLSENTSSSSKSNVEQTNTEVEENKKTNIENEGETETETETETESETETETETEDEGEIEPLIDNGANVIQAELDNKIDEEIDLFEESNDVIILKNKEIAPEFEQIYEDDIVYIRDIENELLKEVPINRQNNKLVQEAITKQAQNLVELKNLGKDLINKDENYSQVFYDILNNQYPHDIIIPVVLDKQRVYVNSEEEIDDTLIKEELETDNDIESSISIQLQKIKELKDAFQNGDITYEKYETDKRNILKPFIIKNTSKSKNEIELGEGEENESKEVGFHHSLKDNVDLLRFYGIDTTEFQQYKGLTDLTTTVEIYDDNNAFKGLKEKIVIPADDVNIVGFLVLPSNADTLDEILNGDKNIENFVEVGNISSISKGPSAVITIENHNLDADNKPKIIINGTNSVPAVDGEYEADDYMILDKNQISVNVDTSEGKEGDKGSILQEGVLKIEKISIDKDEEGVITIDPAKKEIQKQDVAKLYTFNTFKVSETDYQDIIKLIVPNISDIISYLYDDLSLTSTIEEINDVFKKYKLTLNSLTIEQYNTIEQFIERQIKDHMEEYKEFIDKKEDDKKKELQEDIKIEISHSIFNNDIFTSNDFITLFGNYPFLDTYYDSIQKRLDWINLLDNGFSLYLKLVIIEKYNEKDFNQQSSIEQKDITSSLNDIISSIDEDKKKQELFNNCSKYSHEFETLDEFLEDVNEIKNALNKIKELENQKKEIKEDKDIKKINEEIDETKKLIKYKKNDKIFIKNKIDKSDIAERLKEIRDIELTEQEQAYEHGLKASQYPNQKENNRLILEQINKQIQENVYYYIKINVIYEFDGDEFNVYKFSPNLDRLDEICLFSGSNVTDVDEKSLCELTDNGCMPKKYVRNLQKKEHYEQALELVKDISDDYKKLDDLIKGYKLDIQNKIKNLKKFADVEELKLDEEQEQLDEQVEEQKEILEEESKKLLLNKDEITNNEVNKILSYIQLLDNDNEKSFLLFKLLDKDGILIDHTYYSKKYGSPIICGHWKYKKAIFNTNNLELKQLFYQEMLGIYSDGGVSDKAQDVCKVCGAVLGRVDYDDVIGFNDFGQLVVQTELWITEEDREKYLSTFQKKKFFKKEEIINCTTLEFKKELAQQGVDISKFKNIKKICDLITLFMVKLDFQLSKYDFTQCVIKSIEDQVFIDTYPTYRTKIARALIKQKVPKQKIMEIDKSGKFKNDYDIYFENNLHYLTTINFIITLILAKPEYILGDIKSKCVFNGLFGKEGLLFFACLLNENKSIKDIGKKKINRNIIYEQLTELNDRKLNSSIDIKNKIEEIKQQKLKEAKNAEEKKVKTDIEKDQEIELTQKLPISSSVLKDILNTNKFSENIENINDRREYLIYILKKEIMTVVKNSPVLEFAEIENSCCDKTVDQQFLDYINEKSKLNILEIVQEINTLNQYTKFKITSGNSDKLRYQSQVSQQTMNNGISITNRNIEMLPIIKETFESYCFEGATKGQYHNFVLKFNEDLTKCNKCGYKLKDIKKMEYSVEQYLDLLVSISELNSIDTEVATEQFLEKDAQKLALFEQFKNELGNLNEIIDNFVNKLLNATKKSNDKYLFDKYRNLLLNLGDIFIKETEDELRKIINKERYLLISKINNIKYYIVEIIKKNLTKIAFRYESSLDNYNFSEEYNTIYSSLFKNQDFKEIFNEENSSINQLINNQNKELFKKLKFETTNETLDVIVGNTNIYTKDYQKVIEKNDFDLLFVNNLMLYIFVINLDNLIKQALDISKKTEFNNAVYDVGNFILICLNIIESDSNYLRINNEQVELYKNEIYNKNLVTKLGELSKFTETDKKLLKAQSAISEFDSLSTTDLEDKSTSFVLLEKEDQEQSLEDIAKKTILEKTGEEATENEIESYKEEFNQQLDTEEFIDQDEFDLLQPKEGLEILETGDDYGEFHQGTENSGDGLNPYQEEQFFGEFPE